MPLVVTGISQDANVEAVEKALRDAGLSVEPLSVYVAGDEASGTVDAHSSFVYMGNDSIRDMLARGSAGIYSSGGGNVPGIELSSSSEYFAPETVTNELSELDIPDSEIENYEEAMDAGHGVVAYFARPETLSAIEGAFRAAGLRNVRTY